MISEWRQYAELIARSSKKILGPKVEVYVFGSVIRGEAVAGSDVDILVVLDHHLLLSAGERNKIRIGIEDDAGLPEVHPFEIHVVDREESEAYFRHIGSSVLRIA